MYYTVHGVCSCCVHCWPLFNGPSTNCSKTGEVNFIDYSIVIQHAMLRCALGTCEKVIIQTVRILTLKLLNAKISAPRMPSVQSRHLLIKRDLELPSVFNLQNWYVCCQNFVWSTLGAITVPL